MYKKDGGHHFYNDFCKLNARTKIDSYPLSHIQETIESLVGAWMWKWVFGKLPWMKHQSNTLISLWKPRIFWVQAYANHALQCPCHYSRLMQKCLQELNLTYCLIYLDDVIVFSKMEEEYLKHLCVVFDHFQEHNMRLKPTKCKFFCDEITYLAHHVSKECVQPSKENLKAVTSTSNSS